MAAPIAKRMIEGPVLISSIIPGLFQQVQAEIDRIGNPLLKELEFVHVDREKLSKEVVKDITVCLTDPPTFHPYLKDMPKLQWMQSTYAGVDAIFKHSDKRDYDLTRITGVFKKTMSQYVFGWVLSMERKFSVAAAAQEKRTWAQEECRYRAPEDVVIGVMGGRGDIGSHILKTAKFMGFTSAALASPSAGAEAKIDDSDFTTTDLPKFLAACDYVITVLPSTPSTKYMLSGDVLKSCKERKAVLISVGRGDIIDVDSIKRALDEGWIGAAVLDVFEVEPVPKDFPLWDVPGVHITPHVSAMGLKADTARIFVSNLERYVTGEDLEHKVDWDKGY